MHSFTSLDNLAERCAGALDAGRRACGRIVDGPARFDSVVVMGTGDAALAAILLAALTQGSASVPVVDVTYFPLPDAGSESLSAEAQPGALPAFVGRGSLVIALSETGGEAGIITAVGEAADRGARIMTASPAGHLTDIAEAQGYPSIVIPPPLAPAGTLLGELVFAAWGLIAGLPTSARLVPATAADDAELAIALTRRQRKAFGPEAAVDRNPARLLASALNRKVPLLYGVSPAANAACVVWSDRLRRVGLAAVAGDLDRDAAALGWPGRPAAYPAATPMEALILSDPTIPASGRIAKLRAALGAATCNELSLDGHCVMERLWGAVHLAEWTAFYLTP